MQCPRCDCTLRKVNYEGVETDMCDNCWGFWLDKGELEVILESRELNFSTEERDLILAVLGPSDRLLTDPASCPTCGNTMELHRVDELLPIAVDRCREHGIWLDTGELKNLQLMTEKATYIHERIVKALGG